MICCAKSGWNWQSWFWTRMYFHFIFPWKRVWPFIWTNLNYFYQGMLCEVWFTLALSGLSIVISLYFCYIAFISYWNKVWPCIWSVSVTWLFLSLKDALCHVFLKLPYCGSGVEDFKISAMCLKRAWAFI